MFGRMMRAALLQPRAYEEAGRGGLIMTLQAFLVVAITGVLAGVGAGFGDDNFGDGFLGGIGADVGGWLLWAVVTFYIGTKVFSATTSVGETARTIGFAQTPGVLLLFAFVPVAGPIIQGVVTIWRLLAVFVALNVALDINLFYTFLTAVISILPRVALGFLTGLILGIGYV